MPRRNFYQFPESLYVDGAKLRIARKKAKMTLKQAASAVGVHFTLIGMWERNTCNRYRPNLFNLVNLCRAYEVSSLWDLMLNGEPPEAAQVCSDFKLLAHLTESQK